MINIHGKSSKVKKEIGNSETESHPFFILKWKELSDDSAREIIDYKNNWDDEKKEQNIHAGIE